MTPSTAIRSLLALATALLVSCGVGGDNANPSATESTATLAPLSQRLNQNQGYKRDADGNWVAEGDQRSQFESRRASADGTGKNDFNSRRFQSNRYETSEWTRAESRTPQSYTGSTDGSRFQTQAAAQGANAPEASTRANLPGSYRTPTFATKNSRENAARRLDKPADPYSQRANIEPEIIDWKSQRNLSIDQSRSLLAR